MKANLAFSLLIAFLACAHGYPGIVRDTSDPVEDNGKKVDTVLVLPPRLKNLLLGRSALDVPDTSELDDDTFDRFGSPAYFNPFSSFPLDDFLSSMQNVMDRLKERMVGIMSGMLDQGTGGAWGKIPEGANTTSTTKVIDGHIVTINETSYSDVGDGSFGTVIRVRVIDVKPQNETIPKTDGESDAEVPDSPSITDNEKETTPARSVETVEEFDNKISKSPIETLNA